MIATRRFPLFVLAFGELLRIDLIDAFWGFKGLWRSLEKCPSRQNVSCPQAEELICQAMTLAIAYYWKPVRCLQRAAAMTRLLRRFCGPASVVIGYRPSPFFGHAWVELDGRVIYDSPAYQSRLHVVARV
jgi:hypothetical protein